eukprot:CAMPEP_0204824428 /NCGR_PEP_ID=MMETSP1346-20131115/2457_1 /ASSEMBLY_ACC=CAM_ASM_000771 /TAXON_ID=215587 /ORGANISM="Aplanochytrium stocchinoi, Strain GSBS06" /LENGTH=586 /DNA_ID=CAMNT_0051951585 /DNA_START=155 /DNA_END=1915 /DNA_ORIENTATION=-
MKQPPAGLGGLADTLLQFSTQKVSNPNVNVNGQGIGSELGLSGLVEPVDKDGLPVWAVAYYCMRCGAWSECIGELKKAMKQNKIPQSEAVVVNSLEQLVRSSWTLQTDESDLAAIKVTHDALQLANQKQNTSTNIDNVSSPWKRAIFQLVAGDSQGTVDRVVNASIQDFMWFKLCIAISRNNEDFTTADIAKTIISSGPDHFNGSTNPYLFVRLLLMCEEYEHAIGYLALCGRNEETEALHMAIVLKTYGLLQIQNAPPNLNNASGKEDSSLSLVIIGDRLNDDHTMLLLGRLMQRYVSRFAHSNPRAAVLYLLELRPGLDAIDYLKSLLLETNNFSDILDGVDVNTSMSSYGDTNNSYIDMYDGDFDKRGGFLFQLCPEDPQFCLHIVLEAAKAAQVRGNMYAAVQLHLRAGSAECTNEAVNILNRQLVQVLLPTDNDARKKWKRVADSIGKNKHLLEKISKEKAQAFEQLRYLFEFFDLCRERKWENALQFVTWLLPENNTFVGPCASRYRYLDATVREAFPIVMENAVQVIREAFMDSKKRGDMNKMAQLQEQFQAYINLFSNIPVQTAKLAQLIASVEVTMV